MKKICNLALTCGRIAYELGYGADTMFYNVARHFEYSLHLYIVITSQIWIQISRHMKQNLRNSLRKCQQFKPK